MSDKDLFGESLPPPEPARGVECPACQGSSSVLKTRNLGDRVRRIRQCAACGKVFDTVERVVRVRD